MRENENFKLTNINNLSVLAGDAHKLKLVVTSYATILEVQDAYIEEEIDKAKTTVADLKEEITSSETKDKNTIKSKKEELTQLKEVLKSLQSRYKEFSDLHKKFMVFSKKILSLPDENKEELARTGWTIENDTKDGYISLDRLEQTYSAAQNSLLDINDNNIFSNIDVGAISKEVENTMNEKNDDGIPKGKVISDNVNPETFDNDIREFAEDIKRKVDKNKVTADTMAGILNSPFAPAGKTTQSSESPKSSSPIIENNFDYVPDSTPDLSWTKLVEEKKPNNQTIDFGNKTEGQESKAGYEPEINEKNITEMKKKLEEALGNLENLRNQGAALTQEEERTRTEAEEAKAKLKNAQLEQQKKEYMQLKKELGRVKEEIAAQKEANAQRQSNINENNASIIATNEKLKNYINPEEEQNERGHFK